MKKLSLFFLLIAILTMFSHKPQLTYAKSENYAKVLSNGVYIYNLPVESKENAIFEIPNSYYVKLLSQYDEYFYKVTYIDVTGYVKTNQVTPVSSIPTNPFAQNITFRVYSSDGLNIRSEPTTENGPSSIRGTITILDESVVYYGKINGEEIVKNRGNTWYFCKYKTKKEILTGYVYAGFCDMLTQIETNTEEYSPTNNPFKIYQSEIINNQLQPPNEIKNLILVFTILPSFLLVFLLFKPFKIKEKEKEKNFKKITKKFNLKHQKDFYDDPEL